MYSPSFLQKFYRFSSYTKFYDPFWVDIHVGDVRSRSGFIYLFFACEYPAVPASFVENTHFSSTECLDISVGNQLTINMRVYFFFFCFIDLYHTVLMTVAL